MESPARTRAELFLNPYALSQIVGVSRWVLRRQALKGEIRFRVTPEGSLKISVDDALHFAAARSQSAQARRRRIRVVLSVRKDATPDATEPAR